MLVGSTVQENPSRTTTPGTFARLLSTRADFPFQGELRPVPLSLTHRAVTISVYEDADDGMSGLEYLSVGT